MSLFALTVFLVLAAVAVLVGLRLFLVRPRERLPDYRAAFGTDARAALAELLGDPHAAQGRAAEARGEWGEARAAYLRALEALRREEPGDPKVSLKRRALESKLEEIDRVK